MTGRFGTACVVQEYREREHRKAGSSTQLYPRLSGKDKETIRKGSGNGGMPGAQATGLAHPVGTVRAVHLISARPASPPRPGPPSLFPFPEARHRLPPVSTAARGQTAPVR